MTQHFRRPRGRPPHPDLLTPAEWRVLEELRKGRTNSEIGTALGLSLNTVKTHISRMLDKLALPNRQSLAAWDGRPATQPGRRWALLAPLGALSSKTAGIAIATLGVAVAGGLAAAIAAGQLNGAGAALPVVPEPAVVVTPPTPTSTATATPAPTPPPGVRPPGALAQQFVDAGHSLLILEGCVACDGPPHRVVRFDLRSQTETVLVERYDPSGSVSPYLTGAHLSRDGTIYVSECFDGYCGGLDAASPDARTVISRLNPDGSLSPVLEDSFGSYPVAITGEGRFLGLAYVRANPELRWMDTGEPFESPSWSDRRGWHTPLLLADGAFVWEDGPRLRWTDGSTFLDATHCEYPADERDRILEFVEDETGTLFAVIAKDQWSNPTRAVLAIFERDGDVADCVHSVPVSTQIAINLWIEPNLMMGVSPVSGWGSPTRPVLVTLPDGEAELLPFPDDPSRFVGIGLIALLSE